MKKSSVIQYFGAGSVERTAEALGISRRSMSSWPLDAEGRITSALIRDRILARCVRLLTRQRGAANEEVSAIELDLASDDCGAPVDAEDEAQAA